MSENDGDAKEGVVTAPNGGHTAESYAPCEHPTWTEEGDGHGHNYWRCTECDRTQWIAPWVMRGGVS